MSAATATEEIRIGAFVIRWLVDAEATAGGKLTLEWTQDPGAGGTGRGCQVAEVWLLKK